MRVTYYWQEPGKYLKRTWREQCPESIIMGPQCQGAIGHDGRHWSYDARGFFCWQHNYEKDGSLHKFDAAGGCIPPDRAEWPHPVAQYELSHGHFYDDEPVTDAALIERLERGELEGNEGLDRPCTEEEVAAMRAAGEIPPTPPEPRT